MIDLESVQVTPRDQQALNPLFQGCSNKEIAGQLNISPRTVKQHLRTLFPAGWDSRRPEARETCDRQCSARRERSHDPSRAPHPKRSSNCDSRLGRYDQPRDRPDYRYQRTSHQRITCAISSTNWACGVVWNWPCTLPAMAERAGRSRMPCQLLIATPWGPIRSALVASFPVGREGRRREGLDQVSSFSAEMAGCRRKKGRFQPNSAKLF